VGRDPNDGILLYEYGGSYETQQFLSLNGGVSNVMTSPLTCRATPTAFRCLSKSPSGMPPVTGASDSRVDHGEPSANPAHRHRSGGGHAFRRVPGHRHSEWSVHDGFRERHVRQRGWSWWSAPEGPLRAGARHRRSGQPLDSPGGALRQQRRPFDISAYARQSGTTSAESSTQTVRLQLIPTPGTPVMAALGTNNTGTYDVIWSTVTDSVIYELQESLAADFSALTGWFWPSSGAETVAGRSNGTYHYRVRGWNALPESGGFYGDWSAPQTMTVLLPPAIPIINAVGIVHYDDFVLSWTAVAGAGLYEVEESTSTDFSVPAASFLSAATQQTIAGRTDGTYYYRVRVGRPRGD